MITQGSDPDVPEILGSPTSVSDEIVIRVAESAAERAAVYQFRYRIYCELLKRTQQYADHSTKIIEEPLDERGVILAASRNDCIIGTVRFNWATDTRADEYIEYYRMQNVEGIDLNRCTITTKMMVCPERDNLGLGVKLACAAFEIATHQGCLVDFIDCNPPKVKYFRRLGYRVSGSNFEHKEYGHVTPMVLLNNDRNHLLRSRSPLLKFVPKSMDNPDWIKRIKILTENECISTQEAPT